MILISLAPYLYSAEIHNAIDSRDIQLIIEILDHDPTQINATTLGGSQPLHLAVGINHKDIIQLLIDRGADVNAATREGFTPLHWAAYMNAGDAVIALRRNGADVDMKTSAGMTALEIAQAENSPAVIESLTGPVPEIEDRRQKTEDRGQKTEGRRQKTEDPASPTGFAEASSGQNVELPTLNLEHRMEEDKPEAEAEIVELVRETEPAPPKPATDTAETMNEAKEAVKQGDYNKAYVLFTKLLREDPGNVDINFHYAMTCYKLGDFSRARLAFERVLDLQPGHPRATTMCGMCNFRTGQYDIAKKYLTKALDLNPPDADREKIEKCLAEIAKGFKRWNFTARIDAGYFDDDNVNVGPASEIIDISPIIYGSRTIDTLTLGDESRPLSTDGRLVSIALSTAYDLGGKGYWSAIGNAAYFQNWISDAEKQESRFTQAMLGVRKISPRNMLQIPLKFANINSGHESLMNLYGIAPGYVTMAGSKGNIQLMTSGSVESRDYDTLNARDGVFASAGETIKYLIGLKKHSVSAGILLSHDFTDKSIYEYTGISANVGGQIKLPLRSSLYTRFKYTRNDYNDRETLAPEARRDDQFQYLIGVRASIMDNWGLDLNYQITDNNSTFGLYEYERNVASLNTFFSF